MAELGEKTTLKAGHSERSGGQLRIHVAGKKHQTLLEGDVVYFKV